MPKKLKTKKQTSTGRIFATAFAATLLTALLLSMVFSKTIMMGLLGQSAIGVLAIIITAVSSFIGCSIAGKSMPEKKLLWGYLVAVSYLALALLGKAVFVRGPVHQLPAIVLAALGAATAAGLLQAKPKKKRRI